MRPRSKGRCEPAANGSKSRLRIRVSPAHAPGFQKDRFGQPSIAMAGMHPARFDHPSPVLRHRVFGSLWKSDKYPATIARRPVDGNPGPRDMRLEHQLRSMESKSIRAGSETRIDVKILVHDRESIDVSRYRLDCSDWKLPVGS